jgi:hypothetical protein
MGDLQERTGLVMHHLPLYFYSALGVFVLASRWGHDGLRLFVPRALIETFHLDEDRNTQIEFAIFIIVGAVIGVVASDPVTARQAVAAGLGWTGLLTIPNSSKMTRGGKSGGK